MIKKNLLLIFLIIVLVSFFLFLVQKSGRNAEKAENQKIEIQEQKQEIKKVHEIIETKQNQQKIINKTFDNVNIDARREWLRLIFQERNASPETN
tara:strand:- start:2009 stop:2293 length:285 start_codon:yes stop_codon:yes gene_type:complete